MYGSSTAARFGCSGQGAWPGSTPGVPILCPLILSSRKAAYRRAPPRDLSPPGRLPHLFRRPREGGGPSLTPDAAAAGGEWVEPPNLSREPRLGPGFPARGRGQAGSGATVGVAQCGATTSGCVNPVAPEPGPCVAGALLQRGPADDKGRAVRSRQGCVHAVARSREAGGAFRRQSSWVPIHGRRYCRSLPAAVGMTACSYTLK